MSDPLHSHLIGGENRFRLLVIESDRDRLARVVGALNRRCCKISSADRQSRNELGDVCAQKSCLPDRGTCCVAIDSLASLRKLDNLDFDLVLCAMNLRDGNGLEAMRLIRVKETALPMVLMGAEEVLIQTPKAIREGAIDVLLVDHAHLKWLPLLIGKWIEQQRIRNRDETTIFEISRELATHDRKNQNLQAQVHRLEMKSRIDVLTGLFNRRWLNLALTGCWADAIRNDLPLAFLMIDLDGFKGLNDTMGHHQGDRVLQLAAKVIKANCRHVDVVARYGGDEFCVLMPHTKPNEVVAVAERIHHEFELAMTRRPKGMPHVGMSIGVSHTDLSRPSHAEQLVMHADEAMYAAKSAGKQCIMVKEMDGTRVA